MWDLDSFNKRRNQQVAAGFQVSLTMLCYDKRLLNTALNFIFEINLLCIIYVSIYLSVIYLSILSLLWMDGKHLVEWLFKKCLPESSALYTFLPYKFLFHLLNKHDFCSIKSAYCSNFPLSHHTFSCCHLTEFFAMSKSSLSLPE